MKTRYKLFLAVQLLWSLLSGIRIYIIGRSSADNAPESFFLLGAVFIGTILYIALQPLINRPETQGKACVILIIGYILVFNANLGSFKDKVDFFSVCCLVLSAVGIIVYAVTDKGVSAHLSSKISAKAVFFLLLIFSILCSVSGNIALIRSSETALHNKIMDIIMIFIIISASITFFFLKNQSAGKIHLCALLISGLSFESPSANILLLLIIAEFFTLTNKFGIYTSN